MTQWKWCLEDENKKLLTGWQKIGNYWYFLDVNGTMVTGWYQDTNKKWYYFNASGQMATGWIQLNDKWYYLYKATDATQGEYIGTTAYSCTKTIDSKDYTFDAEGVWQDSLVSENCLSFVKGYEKFYSYKYDDGTGEITQGYGATGAEIVNWGDTITEEEASEEFKNAINEKYAKPIKADLDSKGIKLEQNQFDAIVSCAYNIGVGDSTEGLLGSTLYKYIISGGRDSDTILKYFRMWNKVVVNGVIQVWEGLNKRRVAEANIFNNGVYDSTH